VGVVELHDAAAGPAAVGRGPGIALQGNHLVTTACQPGTHEQAAGTQSDDGDSRDDHPVRYTNDALITSIVQLTYGAVKMRTDAR
jgi:hypothetical protein